MRVDGTDDLVWARMTGSVTDMKLDQAASGATVWWATVNVTIGSTGSVPGSSDYPAGMTLWASATHFTPAEPAPAIEPETATPLYPGRDSDRQSVGKPGHCSDCARIGHVAAHLDFGCSDVGCDRAHDE